MLPPVSSVPYHFKVAPDIAVEDNGVAKAFIQLTGLIITGAGKIEFMVTSKVEKPSIWQIPEFSATKYLISIVPEGEAAKFISLVTASIDNNSGFRIDSPFVNPIEVVGKVNTIFTNGV